jgi:flagellar hook-associated protein 3 FlgL
MGYLNFLADLMQTRRNIDKLNQEISSGRSLLTPSDDPAGASEVLQLRGAIAANGQFKDNTARAKTFLSFADSALNSVVNLLTQAKEKAIAGATGTQTAQTRAVLATEVQNIRDQIVSLANSSVEGIPVFAGQRVMSPPFVLDPAALGGVRYDGDDGVNQIDIAANDRIDLNTPGSRIFTGPGANVFTGLRTIIDGLNTNDPTLINAGLSDLANGFDQVRNARQDIGARMALVDRNQTRLNDERLQLTTSVSALEDTNLAEAISSLVQNQTAENATLSIGARLSRRSLFDIIS